MKRSTIFAAMPLLALAPIASAAVSSTYNYSVYTYGGYTNKDYQFKSEFDSAWNFSSGTASVNQYSTGYHPFIDPSTNAQSWLVHEGDTHAQGKMFIDSDAGILKAYAHTEAQQAQNYTSSRTTIDMNARQYYTAEGSEPITVQVSFHYDGDWNFDDQSMAKLGLGTYVTKVLDETAYFQMFEYGLEVAYFSDFLPGSTFYTQVFGNDDVAQTLGHTILTKETKKSNNSYDINTTFDFVVNPGEIIAVDTMLALEVSSKGQYVSDDTSATIDFYNTAYSNIQVTSGNGSLVNKLIPIDVPIVPEPASLTLLSLASLLTLTRSRTRA